MRRNAGRWLRSGRPPPSVATAAARPPLLAQPADRRAHRGDDVHSHGCRWLACSAVGAEEDGAAAQKARLRRWVDKEMKKEIRQDKLIRRIHLLWALRDRRQKADFLRFLAAEFGAADHKLAAAAGHLAAAEAAGGGAREASLLAAREAMVPEYERLAVALAELPQGMRLVLDMRAELLAVLRAGSDPSLAALERHLQKLLRGWFAPAGLSVERCSWDGSPAPLLERLIAVSVPSHTRPAAAQPTHPPTHHLTDAATAHRPRKCTQSRTGMS